MNKSESNKGKTYFLSETKRECHRRKSLKCNRKFSQTLTHVLNVNINRKKNKIKAIIFIHAQKPHDEHKIKTYTFVYAKQPSRYAKNRLCADHLDFCVDFIWEVCIKPSVRQNTHFSARTFQFG